VMVRLVTRLAHSRGIVRTGDGHGENPSDKRGQAASWILLPANARRRWRALIERQRDIREYTAGSRFNTVEGGPAKRFGVITTGLARNYLLENLADLPERPALLHVGAYPYPAEAIRAFVAPLARVLLLEEGYPYIERALRGIVPPAALEIQGRESGELPPDGELNPDIVRAALGLPLRQGVTLEGLTLPNRPPQLCAGCPHGDSLHAITSALASIPGAVVTADIGCSTLGALPPYNAVETCVCMGASIGMAKGAADAGVRPVVAVIGDSTFLHSGITPLMDAVKDGTPMTLVILDNKTVAMTGGQPTILSSSELVTLVHGLGVPPGHLHVIEAHPRRASENTETLRRAVGHPGLSVVIAVRECVETVKRGKREKPSAAAGEVRP
ncbi:MAG TPA: thiamine pyrophosphate-dependent enzyme, partial [Vicinamibacterales bacterium]|nr:thiamine pyrophosphate-dependent enzyme [Vicinamibacterales bacterium]